MSKPRQQVIHTVDEQGAIHVSTTPFLTGNIESFYIDSEGIRHIGFSTEESVRAAFNIPDDYETVDFKPNSWIQQDSTGPFVAHQIRANFSPPKPGQVVMESLLKEIKSNSPKVPNRFVNINRKKNKRMLEISVMDPHFGMQCFAPGADHPYDLNLAHQLYAWAISELSSLGMAYGDVTEILFPIGNDFLHAEPMAMSKGIGHATAGGTVQPEMVAWHHAYIEGEKILREAITFLSELAPVHVVVIPGNHDRYSAFTLGRVMNAYFHNDANVTVECDTSPYKFKRFGVNLIGFEHGHSVAPIRLAALMANERPQDWAETSYREWHLGDQHRKGVSKPSTFEEQGVSVEYLPSLVAPNEWHRIKSFNWQKRGAMAWVWDYHYGPTARLQVNLNSYTGKPYVGPTE